jgi:hypothetical protein
MTRAQTSQIAAGYLGAEHGHGPYRCGSCLSFHEGACDRVAGRLDPDGCCTLYRGRPQQPPPQMKYINVN